MTIYHESRYYDTLEELQKTHSPSHQDIIALQKKYGEKIRFSTVMHPKGVIPRFELRCYEIK